MEKQFEFKVTQFGISSKVVRRTGLDLAQSPAASETLGKSAAATPLSSVTVTPIQYVNVCCPTTDYQGMLAGILPEQTKMRTRQDSPDAAEQRIH